MTKKQKIEEEILTDLLFGAKTYGYGPEYKKKVRDYFDGLLQQATAGGKVTFGDGVTIDCSPELVHHYMKRYSPKNS